MTVTIEIPESDPMTATSKKIALDKLAKNITKENLMFLAELSEKPNVNAKLESKKAMIKTFL